MALARSATAQRLLIMAAQQLRRATSASGLNGIDELLDEGGMHLVELPGYNRGLLAAKDLPQGSLLLREMPLLCARAPQHAGKVCDACLKVFPTAFAPLLHSGTTHSFCSPQCSDAGLSFSRPRRRRPALDPMQPLNDMCAERGERFPLLIAILACRLLLDRDGAAQQTLQQVMLLTHVRIANPPRPWIEAYEQIHTCLELWVASLPTADEQERAAARLQELITPSFFMAIMSRLHINSFRVDAIFPVQPGASLAAMAAAVIGGGAEGHSGSALYFLGSMFNHACSPSVSVSFPDNDSRVEFRTARAVDKGEQLCITYIPEGMSRSARRDRLAFAYGFECNCDLCREELELT